MRILILLTILSIPNISHAVSGPWPAPNTLEADGIEQGQKKGIGSVTLIGPDSVTVSSYHTTTIRYTVGPAGLAKGGSVLVGMRHMQHLACPPQIAEPQMAGYVTLAGDHVNSLTLDIPTRQHFPAGRFFAWQHIVRATNIGEPLPPGAIIDFILGDTSGGGPGMLAQPFDETHYGFKAHVDTDASDVFLPLADTPTIKIVADSATAITAITPSDAVMGEDTWCLVRAEDAYGNPADSFRGTVVLTSKGLGDATLSHAFTEADQGVYRFENIRFSKSGTHTIDAKSSDFHDASNPVIVTKSAPDELLLWGDLHGHTLFSDGRGTVEEFYDFADRVAGLDFCAVTDHAFQIRDEMWEHTKKATNAALRPGQFITFHAFEWSGVSPLGGDHNVFFLEDDPPIYRSTLMYDKRSYQMQHDAPKQENIELVYAEMLQRLKDKNIFCIPHYGGRRGNPGHHHPNVQRMIEVFSEHRRSEDWSSQFLTQGYRLGIMASTDGHYGNPGYGFLRYSNEAQALSDMEIGMAAVAVYAPERSRESIFKSLYDRRVYATSGDRIILDFSVEGHPMGSEITCDTAPTMRVNATGTAAINRVEFKKNGVVLHVVNPNYPTLKDLIWKDPIFKPGETAHYYVRIVQDNGEEAISSPVWVN